MGRLFPRALPGVSVAGAALRTLRALRRASRSSAQPFSMSHAGKLRLTVVALLGAAVVASCRDRHKTPTAPATDTVAQLDTQTTSVVPADPPKPALSPLADTIAD